MKTSGANAAALKDLEVLPSLRMAAAGSLVLTLFTDTTAKDLDAMVAQLPRVATQNDGHLTMIHLVRVGEGQGKISDELRKKAHEIITAVRPSCRGSGTVILGSGLAATIIRMFLTGFVLVTKAPFPQRSFATVAEALAWARELPGQKADVLAVTAEQVHAHFELGPVK